MEIKEKVFEILKEETGNKLEYDRLDFDISLIEQGVDSLDFNSILLAVEEVFEIEIPDEEIENLSTLNALLNFINLKVN